MRLGGQRLKGTADLDLGLVRSDGESARPWEHPIFPSVARSPVSLRPPSSYVSLPRARPTHNLPVVLPAALFAPYKPALVLLSSVPFLSLQNPLTRPPALSSPS